MQRAGYPWAPSVHICFMSCFLMFHWEQQWPKYVTYVLSCPALFFFPPADGTTPGVKIEVYLKTGLGILDVWHAILIYCLLRRMAILPSVMRTLLSLRVTDPTKVADIDRWKGMCDPTTPVEITTENSLVAVYSSILFELSAALALSAQGIETYF